MMKNVFSLPELLLEAVEAEAATDVFFEDCCCCCCCCCCWKAVGTLVPRRKKSKKVKLFGRFFSSEQSFFVSTSKYSALQQKVDGHV